MRVCGGVCGGVCGDVCGGVCLELGGALLRHRGGNPELFTSLFLFPEFLFILFIPSFCRVNALLCPQLLLSFSFFLPPHRCRDHFSFSPFSLFSPSQAAPRRMHRVKGKSDDRGSLEQSDLEMILLFFPSSSLWSPALLVSPRLTSLPSSARLCFSLLVAPSDPNAVGQHGTDHALIGGVVAVVVFVTLCLIIVLGRYLARHKGKTSQPYGGGVCVGERVEHIVAPPISQSERD